MNLSLIILTALLLAPLAALNAAETTNVQLDGGRRSRCWLATDPTFDAAEAAAAIADAAGAADPIGDTAGWAAAIGDTAGWAAPGDTSTQTETTA